MASCGLYRIIPGRHIITKPVESQGKLGEVYLLLYFLDRVSLIPGWPSDHYTGEDDLELLTFLPQPSLVQLLLVLKVLGFKSRALSIQDKQSNRIAPMACDVYT